MKKNIVKLMAFALTVASVGVVTSCKDYDEDRMNELEQVLRAEDSNLQKQIDELKKALDDAKNDLSDKIAALENDKLSKNDLQDAIEAALKEAKESGAFDGKDGKDGADGKDGVDGKDGKDGADGKDGVDGKDGKDGADGAAGADGKNAYSPYIGENGNWFVYNDETGKFSDSGVKATGADGKDGAAGAAGADGVAGADGKNGHSPYIGDNGNWFVYDDEAQNYKDTEIKAAGVDGTSANISEIINSEEFQNLVIKYIASLTPGAVMDEIELQLREWLKEHISEFTKSCECASKLADLEKRVAIIEGNYATKGYVDSAIEGIKNQLAGIKSDIANIKSSLAKLITGISVEAADNQAYGYILTPFGIKSNLLLGYYGVTASDVEFPTDDDTNYIIKGEVLTAEEAAMIGSTMGSFSKMGGQSIISNADDNLGKLYFNVNPSNVDFSGENFVLVNSQDEQSKVTLKNVKLSDATLTMGYTRAANGFYEADANFNASDIDAIKVEFEEKALLDDVKTIFKDAKNNKTVKADAIADLAKDVYSNVSEIVPALGIKVSYTDPTVGERSIISDYEIAAAAFKPLNFSSGSQLSVTEMPGYTLANKAVDKAFDKLKDGISEAIGKFDLDKLASKLTPYITFLRDESSKDIVKFKFAFDQLKFSTDANSGANKSTVEVYSNGVKLDQFEVDFKASGTYVDKDNTGGAGSQRILISVQELLDKAGVTSADVNSLCDQIEDLLDELKDIDATLDKYMDKAQNLVQKYLDKANSKFVSLIDKSLKVLQPTMLVSGEDGVSIMSTVASAPTLSGANIVIYPTTYNGEIVTPCYKKHIAVVNVIKGSDSAQAGDATCKSLLDAANSQSDMNTVLDGTVHSIAVAGLQSGYTYEFAYSALDFGGNIVTRRCYVTVK